MKDPLLTDILLIPVVTVPYNATSKKYLPGGDLKLTVVAVVVIFKLDWIWLVIVVPKT